MTESTPEPKSGATSRQPRTPSRREVLRPWELLSGSFIAAVFVFIMVLAGTRRIEYALIATGAVFIITLLGLSMFSLAIKPSADEQAELDEQNQPKSEPSGPDQSH